MTYRWVRPLTAAALGIVVTSAFQIHPRPGAHGSHLAITVALLSLIATTITLVRARLATASVQLVVAMAVVGASAALSALQPNGPGFLGMFPAVSGAALRLPEPMSRAVLVASLLAISAAWAVTRHHPFTGVALNELGVAAFYVVSMFARRDRESNERAERLIAELEETRAAQAAAAALRERQRLAREVHDVLAHSLSGLVLNLESARVLAARTDASSEMSLTLDRAHRLAKSGLDEARQAIAMLRDDELPGPDGLSALARDFADDTGVACSFEVSGAERDLGDDGRLTLYRVAQEALTNVRKHARAERVDVRLAYENDGTRLVVENVAANATSLDARDGTGFGLTGMRERAALIGATVVAGPTERGFRVELWVPA